MGRPGGFVPLHRVQPPRRRTLADFADPPWVPGVAEEAQLLTAWIFRTLQIRP
jgi:hypothetical protein